MAKRTTHTKSVTLQDIADRCGISKCAVSYALRGDRRYVSEKTTAQILAVAKELGYDPSLHHAARRLALQKSGQQMLNQVIALFFPPQFSELSYFRTIFHGILNHVVMAEYGLLTHYTSETMSDRLPSIFQRGDIDGVIVYARLVELTMQLNKLKNQSPFGQQPMVSIIDEMDGCSAILCDDYSGAYAAAKHLLDLGHRHVLHTCIDLDYYPHRQRLAGYRQAYQDLGLDATAYLHTVSLRWWVDHQEAAAALQATLQAHPEVTAILALNDLAAVRIATVLRRVGLRVPEDYSLIGFDDADPLLDSRGENMLTTVHVPLVEMGQQAAQRVIQEVTGQAKGAARIVLPASFVQRASTAPPRNACAKVIR